MEVEDHTQAATFPEDMVAVEVPRGNLAGRHKDNMADTHHTRVHIHTVDEWQEEAVHAFHSLAGTGEACSDRATPWDHALEVVTRHHAWMVTNAHQWEEDVGVIWISAVVTWHRVVVVYPSSSKAICPWDSQINQANQTVFRVEKI